MIKAVKSIRKEIASGSQITFFSKNGNVQLFAFFTTR
jgi:hypothetical protein